VYVDHTGYAYAAENLVDGLYEPSNTHSSMAHSEVETRPWWRVDLEDVRCVWAVNILNRFEGKLGCRNGTYNYILYIFC